MVRPHAGETVGLQLHFDLQLVGLALVEAALHLLHLGKNPEQLLDMVAHLVGDDVGLGELARLAVAAAEPVFQVAEERGVDVDALIAGAVERPHGGLRHAAARLIGHAGEHHQPRGPVVLVGLLEDLLPAVLGIAEDGGDELAHLVAGRAGVPLAVARGAFVLRLAPAAHHLGAADQEARIDAERPADEAEHHDGADPQAAGAARHAEAAAPAAGIAFVAAILDVVAAAEILPAHYLSPPLRGRHCRRPPRRLSTTPGATARSRRPRPRLGEPFPFGYSRACSPDKFIPAV